MKNMLTQLGLDKTEAGIYLALLELGTANVTEITSTAGVTRTLGYHTLDKLVSYGLVKSVSRGTSAKKVFAVENPERLVSFVEEKKNNWEKKLSDAKKNLPDFLSMYALESKPTLKFYDGIEEVKSVSRETLLSATAVQRIINLPSTNDSQLSEYIQNASISLQKADLNVRTLYIDGTKNSKKEKSISSALLPGIADFIGELTIYEHKISIVSPSKYDTIGFTIDSEMLSALLKATFELAWNSIESRSLQQELL